jgi:signal transduction histidine kinase
MSEQSDALERERAARVSSESALDRSQSLLERTLSERLQLGRTLHDDTCQVLYGVTLHLDALRTHVSARAPDLEPGLARSLEQLRTLNRRVRSYVDALETQPLPESSFRSVCAEATAPFSGIPGIRFEVRTPQSDSPLRPDFAEDVVHVLRESVSNAVRHGKADRIEICVEHTQNETSLAIRDNGCGFDPAAKGGGHGLSNLKARAERTHGRLTIESFLGKGTLITFTWPRQ